LLRVERGLNSSFGAHQSPRTWIPITTTPERRGNTPRHYGSSLNHPSQQLSGRLHGQPNNSTQAAEGTMSDARWDDPREYGDRNRDDERARVYNVRDRDGHDPRDGLMCDLDLPRGDARELVVDRARVYELGAFVDELALLQPTPGYMRLVKDRILCAWEQRRAEAKDRTTEQQRRVSAIQQKLDKLDEAFLYAEAIDVTTYGRQRDKLREELTLAKIDRPGHRVRVE
jgi:hypothetical protein